MLCVAHMLFIVTGYNVLFVGLVVFVRKTFLLFLTLLLRGHFNLSVPNLMNLSVWLAYCLTWMST